MVVKYPLRFFVKFLFMLLAEKQFLAHSQTGAADF